MGQRSVTLHRAISDLRVAIVGLGSIGARHLQNLATLGVSSAIVVRRPQIANSAFQPPADATVVTNSREAIDAGADLAVICNPTSLHVATASEYLAAGVAVLLEKPLANDFNQAQRLVDETERGGAWAGMAYCLRYHPAYRRAYDILTSGKIGRIHYAKAWFEGYLPEWHPWEDYRRGYAARADLGGGALPTLDHELDFLNWCLGPPDRVAVCSGRSGALEADVDDMATVSLRYDGGVLASGLFSFCRHDPSRGFEFVADQGTVRFSMQASKLELLASGKTHTLWQDPEFNLNGMYLDMLKDALTAFAMNQPPPTSVRAGLDALRSAGL